MVNLTNDFKLGAKSLYFDVIDDKNLTVEIRIEHRTLDKETLTIGRNFDRLLLTSIDKLLKKNKIERLSLKTSKIRGKIDKKAVSGMIIGAVFSALRL